MEKLMDYKEEYKRLKIKIENITNERDNLKLLIEQILLESTRLIELLKRDT